MPPKRPLDFYSESLPGVDRAELRGKLIVIEGPDAVGRSTQVSRLKEWLEHEGHAVLDTGLARSALAGKGIAQAKEGNTFGPLTMTLFYATDFADRLENEIVPALRAGFVVLTDRYIYSLIARAVARGEDREWIEKVASFALVPHAIYYMRAEVKQLVSRVVVGQGRIRLTGKAAWTCALATTCTTASSPTRRVWSAPWIASPRNTGSKPSTPTGRRRWSSWICRRESRNCCSATSRIPGRLRRPRGQ